MKKFAFAWFDHNEGDINLSFEKGSDWKEATEKFSLCNLEDGISDLIIEILNDDECVFHDVSYALCECEINLTMKEIK